MSSRLRVYLDGKELNYVYEVSTHCGYGSAVVASRDKDGDFTLENGEILKKTLYGHIYTEEIK
jgi:hypothetical protein